LPKDWAEGHGKKVVTVHGASAFSEDLYDPDRGESIKHNLQTGLSKLARIITVSKWSKAELIKHFELPESLITVIPNGVDLKYFEPKDSEQTSNLLEKKFSLRQPYLLHLGPGQARKNILTTIKAFALLKQRFDTQPDRARIPRKLKR